MRILCACECSQTLTKAFRKLGHEAFSCDISPPYGEKPILAWHIQSDVEEVLGRDEKWHLICMFPPCTYIICVGNRWFNSKNKNGTLKYPDREQKREAAISFVKVPDR